MRRPLFWPSLGLFLAFAASAQAAVDLVTLPTREGTQLTIYNSQDITMVREHRLLTVKEGVNRIQFSWANTLIDPTSIEFRILDKQDQVDLVDTTFPSGRNDALQWNVKSQIAGKVPVEIRYFTSGITWAADYVGIANEDETKLAITGYVRVTNQSGELYDNAQTRLVVGNINLVEKIADLANRPPPRSFRDANADDREKMKDAFQHGLVLSGANNYIGNTIISGGTLQLGSGALLKAPEIVKQGLSEYFLFTIEGREDIKDKEPKRLVALKVAEAPLESIYKLSDRTADKGFTKFYRFKNIKLLDDKGKEKKLSAMENLGLSPLPNGAVRLFSEYKNKDLAYVGGTETKYVPIGDRVEVNVGPDKDITIRRRVKDQKTGNLVARQYKRRLDNDFLMYYDLIDYNENVLLRGRTCLRQAGDSQGRGRAAVRRQRRALGRRRRAQGLDEQRAGGLRRSAHDRRPRGTGRSTAREVFHRPLAGQEAGRPVQRDLQASQGRAGTERGEEAGAAMT